MSWQSFSSRSRHHPFAGGFPNPHSQPGPTGFGSAPGTNRLVETAGSCVTTATPTASNKLRVDSGSWPDCGIYCGYNVNINGSGIYFISTLETDIVEDDTLVINANPFTGIGISIAVTIDVISGDFVFPADSAQPGFDFLFPGAAIEIIDANIIELQVVTTFDYQGSPAWFVMGLDDGDIMQIDTSVSSNGYFVVQLDPVDHSRLSVPGGHGLPLGLDNGRILRWYRRCDRAEILPSHQSILYDWDFHEDNLANLYTDLGETINVVNDGDEIRVINNKGNASSSGQMVEDVASTVRATWKRSAVNGHGALVLPNDGGANNVAFRMTAPQDGFVDAQLSYLILFKSNRDIRASGINQLTGWDDTGSFDGFSISLQSVGGAEGVFKLELFNIDVLVALAEIYQPILPDVWYVFAGNIEEQPAGSADIDLTLSDVAGAGTATPGPPAPVPVDAVNEDAFIGRTNGAAVTDWGQVEIGRLIIWDERLGSTPLRAAWATINSIIGAELPIDRLPGIDQLMHWYDFTDIGALFTDTGGTTPVTTTGDLIANITNKGNHAHFASNPVLALIQSTMVERPEYIANAYKTLSAGRFRGSQINLEVVPVGQLSGAGFGGGIGVIFRIAVLPTSGVLNIFNWGANWYLQIDHNQADILEFRAGTIITSIVPVIDDIYLAFIIGDPGTDNDATFISPGPEDNPSITPVNSGTSQTLRIGSGSTDIDIDVFEAFIYDEDLDQSLRDRVALNTTRRYGALPNG